MKKNVIFWIGVKSTDPIINKKYGEFKFFEYSRNTWEYVCKKNNWLFVPYEKQLFSEDTFTHRITWQRWFDVFDILESQNIDYDQILLADGTTMVRWDYPDIFKITNYNWSAINDIYNMRWVYDSIKGYSHLFPNYTLDPMNYYNCGFVIFNKSHKKFLRDLTTFYVDNFDEIYSLQKEKVKKGTDQTPINWMLQTNNIEITRLPNIYNVAHLQKLDLLRHNWQLNEDRTPFFIKHFYGWMFSGLADKGQYRNKMMKDTWEIIKENYV